MKITQDYYRLQIIKTLQRIFIFHPFFFHPFTHPVPASKGKKKKKERKRHFEGILARKSILCHQDVLLIELFSLLKRSQNY